HQISIADPIRQHDPAVAYACSLEQRLRVDHIEIEPWNGLAKHRGEVRDVLAGKVQHVGCEVALLQQELTTRQVCQPRVNLRPPGDVSIEVGSDVLRLITGLEVQCRLMNEEGQNLA